MAKSGKVRSLVATDQLTADGGTVWRDPSGHRRWRRIAKFAFAGGTFLLCLFLALASIGLPFPGKVGAARAEATSIYARDGQTLLYKIRGDKNRTAIPFDQMPKCIKDATVATEDKSFYKHRGLDPRGFARAVLVNLEVGYGSQGGSTITQQLVKNALLNPERTLTRKAKELVLSLEIEQMYSKDDILRLYLNEIPYGNNAYGVQAAAQTYFARDAKDLTLAQCATLAAIPRAPTYYSPYNNADPERLKSRSKYVLDQMTGEGYVTPEQSAAAKAEIDRGLEYAAAKGEDIKAPHFVFYVREQLERKYGSKATQEGGMKVVTTLDAGKQDIAEDVIKDARGRFPGFGASNAALTAVDPKTGQLVAMVGSVDYFDIPNQGNVNVATADRQPGSSFKPLVYLKGFQEGYDPNLKLAYNPATLLWDVKTDFGGGYAPNNYDGRFRGPVSARDALQQSLNVPAVKMVDLVGVEDSINLAHQMGITTLNDPDRYGDSLVLGGGEVKLIDLTTAYSVMANQGTAAWSECFDQTCRKRNNVTPFLEVRDRKNKVLERYETNKKKEIVSQELAYQISDVLKDDRARAPQFGSGGPLTLPGRPDTAAKTGTTDSFRDAWTVGYTPQLTAGVWLGNNDNSPMNRVGGSQGAAPIWNAFMRRALEGQPAEKFSRPPGIEEIQVDRLTGMLPNGRGGTKTEIVAPNNKPRDKSPVNSGAAGECKPSVSIVSPRDGAVESGTVSIQATATSDGGIKQVSFSVDGRGIGTDEAPPFTASTTLAAGSHTITATATGVCESAQVSGSGLRSERPTNPNWETPVQAYIRQNGLKVPGSGDQDDATATATVNVTVESPRPSPTADPDEGGDGQTGPGANRGNGPGSVSFYLRDDQYG